LAAFTMCCSLSERKYPSINNSPRGFTCLYKELLMGTTKFVLQVSLYRESDCIPRRGECDIRAVEDTDLIISEIYSGARLKD